jgi:hypothetical protein
LTGEETALINNLTRRGQRGKYKERKDRKEEESNGENVINVRQMRQKLAVNSYSLRVVFCHKPKGQNRGYGLEAELKAELLAGLTAFRQL